jgi:hypothetical protein
MVVVREAVELEPEDVRRDPGDLFNRCIAGRGEDIGDAVFLRFGRKYFFRARPHQAGRAHGSHTNRRRIAFPEQFRLG